jgi:hypothetical protein
MLETAAFCGWKIKGAIDWFHGIGRLVCPARFTPCFSVRFRHRNFAQDILLGALLPRRRMDARVEPAHDESGSVVLAELSDEDLPCGDIADHRHGRREVVLQDLVGIDAGLLAPRTTP